MLIGCSYHLLDSLLPPLLKKCEVENANEKVDQAQSSNLLGREDFLRLEYLSACRVMEDVSTANQLLSYVPYRLYPALFQAIAQKQFSIWRNTSDGPHSASTPSLVILMKKWSNHTMTVRDLMPPLYVPVAKPHVRQSSLNNLHEDISKFCKMFLSLLPFNFLSRYTKDNRMPVECCVSKLDISGYYSLFGDEVSLKSLEEKVKRAYDPNSPSDYDKCELVTDLDIPHEGQDLSNSIGVICTLSQHHGAGLVVKFRRINMSSLNASTVAPIIDLLVKNNAAEYLELSGCELSDAIIKSIVLMSGTLSGLNMSYSSGFSSLQFISWLPHLCQLDLSGIRLSGKLDLLSNLSQGLKYLKLVGCRLGHADVDALACSHHTSTLCELDISENSFSLPVNFSSLSSLCQKLTQVMILELENCSLNKVSLESFINFTDILRALPVLRILRLTANDFSSRIMIDHLPHLACSRMLQWLCLTIPSDTYLSDDYNIIEYHIKKIQLDFEKRIQALSTSPLYVEWNEEVSYSHWYYSV